jgi:hypothetical protein
LEKPKSVIKQKKTEKNPYSQFFFLFLWRILASKQPKRNKKEKKKKPMQQIERFFLPIFWEYNPQKNDVASLFLFDEFSYPSQKTTEKGKKRKKKTQCTRYKSFFGGNKWQKVATL